MRFKSTKTLVVLLAVLAVSRVMAGNGEILYVNSFEGTGNVPQFVPVDDQAVAAQTLLEIDIDTSSPENQAGLSWSLDQGPPGMTVNAASGLLRWTPTRAQASAHPITVSVEDLAGLANSLDFSVEAIDNSAAPLIQPIADRSIETGVLFQLQAVASDPDPKDSLDFTLDAAPVGMSVDLVTGLIEWLPQPGDSGSLPITVRVTDPGGRFDTETFTLNVADGQPPMIDPVADRGAIPGVLMTVQATASDPDDSDLTFALLERPTGMTVDPASGAITWTPVVQQLGPHLVTVEVRDPSGFSDSTGFDVFVDINRPPVAVDDAGYRVERGDMLSVPGPGVLANDIDPNDDPLSALLEIGPERGALTLDADGGFEYTPDNPAGTIGIENVWAFNTVNGNANYQPLIANLDDDPAAEIIVNHNGSFSTTVYAFDGATGQVEWQTSFLSRQLQDNSIPAVGDIDLDGRPELIFIGGEPDASPPQRRQLFALEHDGGLKWISEPMPLRYYDTSSGGLIAGRQMSNAAVSLADLDGDGQPEILVPYSGSPAGYQVWDAEGRMLYRVEEPGLSIVGGGHPRLEVVDLDLDGDPEVVVGNVAWSHNGELIWKNTDGFLHYRQSHYPVAVNLDDDPYPELVRVRGGNTSAPGDARGNLVALNHDGTLLWEHMMPLANDWAPLSVADVDLDGTVEILRAVDPDILRVINGEDGTVQWEKTVGVWGAAGATAFDMDGDGFLEVILMDAASDLRIWDGRDGTEKLVFDTDGFSNAPQPYTLPVFADVDADGQSEMVTAGPFTFGFSPLVNVWKSPANDWPPMRSIWNQYRYHVTNVNDDLTIPARERPHWLQPGLNLSMINQRLPESRVEESDSFSYRASDGEFASNAAQVEIRILPPNAAPRILSTPKLLASPGFQYRYTPLAVDTDPGESLVWTLAEAPAGMAIDADGTLSWTPSAADLGAHTIVIEVTDTVGVSGFQNFTLEVASSVTVPDLAGLNEAQAIAALSAESLTPDPLREVFSDVVAAGIVAGQDPPAGSTAPAGGAVELEISRGPVPVSVPDLIALNVDDAVAALNAAGLAADAIEFVNNAAPRDSVLSQDPPPGAAAAAGSQVDLLVSGGPRAVITISPTVIPAGSTATVGVSIREVDGAPVDPQPAVTLDIEIAPNAMAGTPPVLDGSDVTTFGDSQGAFAITAAFDAELMTAEAVVAQPLSDGAGADIYSEFFAQMQHYEGLVGQLIQAVETGDSAGIASLDQALADLLEAIDAPRLRAISPIAPAGGMPPRPSVAQAAGFTPGPDDAAYLQASIDLLVMVEQLGQVLAEGNAPDLVINQLNQQLADVAAALANLEPATYGVLDAGGVIVALLGTRVPRLVEADIRAIRQALRDEGLVTEGVRGHDADPDGADRSLRFSLPGLMVASSIRQNIINDFYMPYLSQVARSMATVIAADLLQQFANGGAIVGPVTGGSLAIHVFEIPNSIIEGSGFSTLLAENNHVTIVGPTLIDAVLVALDGLPSAEDAKDLNSINDAIQTQIDNADAIGTAWQEANSVPESVLRGCILDNSPACRQLVYPEGLTSVYGAEGGLSLPAPVVFIVRNLEPGFDTMAVAVASFVPSQQ